MPGLSRVRGCLRQSAETVLGVGVVRVRLVLDISEEGLTVHCLDMRTIDANDPSRTIARPFEKHLEKSFG